MLLHPCVCMCESETWERAGAVLSQLTASPNLEQVWDTAAALNRTAEPSLQSLERQLAARPEPLRAVQRLQGLLQTLLGYTAAIPFWRNPAVSLEALAEQVDLYDWYRCVPPPACPCWSPLLSPGQWAFSSQCLRSCWGRGWGHWWSLAGVPHGDVCYKVRDQSLYPELPVDTPLGPELFAWLCPAPPARALGLAPCPAHECRVPAGGWATWACCCSMWPSASWCWSASSAAPRGSWSGESEGPGTSLLSQP